MKNKCFIKGVIFDGWKGGVDVAVSQGTSEDCQAVDSPYSDEYNMGRNTGITIWIFFSIWGYQRSSAARLPVKIKGGKLDNLFL